MGLLRVGNDILPGEVPYFAVSYGTPYGTPDVESLLS
jgi:hypothetical protein